MEKEHRAEEKTLLVQLLSYCEIREPDAAAEALLSKFGCFSGIFDARISHLENTPGITHNAALLIKLMPQLARRGLIDRNPLPRRINQEGFDRYLMAYFFGRMTESLLVFAADRDGKILDRLELAGQTGNSIPVNLRRLVEFSVSSGADTVTIVHNHPGGFAVPSAEDYDATQKLITALEGVGITLSDHLIVAEDDYISMAQSGSLDYIQNRRKLHE